MGRFVHSMQVSLDLRIERVPGDAGAGEWLRVDEEPHHYAVRDAKEASSC
ncbi:hypothetical protein [Nonomuraea sp. NPDC001831]